MYDETWRRKAACRGVNTDVFFPAAEDSFDATRHAKAICASCPVKVECYAENHDVKHGVFSATTGPERSWLRARKLPVEVIWAKNDCRLSGQNDRNALIRVMADYGLSVSQIRDALGLAHSTVWSVLHRASKVA